MTSDYEQLYAGKPIAVRDGSSHFVSCCDCGLVHKITFTLGKGEHAGLVSITATLDNRATAGRRRAGALRARLRAIAARLGLLA